MKQTETNSGVVSTTKINPTNSTGMSGQVEGLPEAIQAILEEIETLHHLPLDNVEPMIVFQPSGCSNNE